MAKIEITDLCKDFTVEGIKTVHAVKHASLTVNDGEVVVIIGPSGSGKSTLLRSVNKLEEPTSGSIRIDGIEVTDPKTDLRKIREEVGMVFQSFNLFPHLSVLDNITLAPRKVLKMNKAEADELAMSLLKRVGLEDKAKNRPNQLSGGQQQRVALARTLAQNPSIILADEPVASLDPVTAKAVMDDFRNINKNMGITVIINIHHVELALEYCDRVIGVKSGQVIFDGPSRDVDKKVLASIYGDENYETV